jgi:hypothetical protein
LRISGSNKAPYIWSNEADLALCPESTIFDGICCISASIQPTIMIIEDGSVIKFSVTFGSIYLDKISTFQWTLVGANPNTTAYYNRMVGLI